MVSSIDVIFYTLVAFLPGYIIDSVIRLTIPLQARKASFVIYRFIFLSLLNYLISLPLFWSCFYSRCFADNQFLKLNSSFFLLFPLRSLSYGLLILIFLPLFLGNLIVVFYRKRGRIIGLLHFFGIDLSSLPATAWDYVFHDICETFVIITLKNGNVVYGYLSVDAFISSSQNGQDIFVPVIYDKTWTLLPECKGIWIPGTEIQHIEFKKGGETNG